MAGSPFARLCTAALAIASALLVSADRDEAGSYLTPEGMNLVEILPPAPATGSYRYDSDRRVFRETRRLAHGERWKQAVADVDTSVEAMLRNFSCAAGLPLTAQDAPRTAALLARLHATSRKAVEGPKNIYRRKRPFLIDQGEICQPRLPLGESWDYPSGHSTWGWSAALILAEAIPQRRQELLLRGRAYGESRVVCGAHNASAVDAGRTAAAALVAAAHGSPEFRDDVAAARAELAALRHDTQSYTAMCVAEHDLLLPTPY